MEIPSAKLLVFERVGPWHFSKSKQLHELFLCVLTQWGRVTHICVVKPTIIRSDNGLSPGRRQAIIWTNAGILLIGPLGTNFSEILTRIQTFSFKKMHLKMSSAKCYQFCLGLNVLTILFIVSPCRWLSYPSSVRAAVWASVWRVQWMWRMG